MIDAEPGVADAVRRKSAALWFRRHGLLLCLVLQAAILIPRLDLLPVWGDEQFTLSTAAQSPGRILDLVAQDIHPPLYYFLAHYWLMLPWPATAIVKARALSVIFVLLALIAIHHFWLRRLCSRDGLWFFLLWIVSPCLVLYARMARSYTLQLLLASVVIALAVRMLEDPGNFRWWLAYSAGCLTLLYTHYLPGIAVWAAVALLLFWRCLRHCDRGTVLALVGANTVIAIGYLPWVAVLANTTSRVAGVDKYRLVANRLAEHAVKLGYWFVSFHFGESLPLGAVVAGAFLVPLVIWTYWKGLRRAPQWLPLVIVIGAIGYFGASRWVSFAFIPPRLLFLLPFALLLLVRGKAQARRAGTLACGGLFLVGAVADYDYYRGRNFLNKGYLIPFERIAEMIQQRSAPPDTLVIIDTFGTDSGPILALLPAGYRRVLIRGPRSAQQVHEAVQKSRPRSVWYLRGCRDLSPGKLNRLLEGELQQLYSVQTHRYVPYSRLDRTIMNLLGWRDKPSHVYEALEMRRQTLRQPRSRASATGHSGP